MKDIRNILYILISTLLISCNVDNKPKDKEANKTSLLKADSLHIIDSLNHSNQQSETSSDNIPQKDLLPFLDSTIILDLSKVEMSDSSIKPPLTLSKVKKILYSYYKNIGYYIERIPYAIGDSDMQGSIAKDGTNKCVVYFDTATFVSLNNDDIYDAIIQYYLYPPYALCHGNDFQHKSILISKDGKYNILGIDFISQYYVIDSIKQISTTSLFINGNGYDWADWRINRHFKITLKTI